MSDEQRGEQGERGEKGERGDGVNGHFQLRVVESLARLETNMISLVGGGGQKGRIDKLEEGQAYMTKKIYVASGVFVGLSFAIQWIVSFLRTLHIAAK